MERGVSSLLHLFIDLYEKDPSKLQGFLEDNDAFDLDDVNQLTSRRSQYRLLSVANQEAYKELLGKTLIGSSSLPSRHLVLRGELDKHSISEGPSCSYNPLRELSAADITPEEVDLLANSNPSMEDIIRFIASKHGLAMHQYESKISEHLIRERLSSKDLHAEVLRFFADRIDIITSAIEQLDDTDFRDLVPNHMIALFRELHVNAVLGNYGTSCILCGTLLERALQDLLPSHGMLGELIKEAKSHGLLENVNRGYADRIQEQRNRVVHGKIEFSDLSSDGMWEIVTCTRKLISALYKSRLGQE